MLLIQQKFSETWIRYTFDQISDCRCVNLSCYSWSIKQKVMINIWHHKTLRLNCIVALVLWYWWKSRSQILHSLSLIVCRQCETISSQLLRQLSQYSTQTPEQLSEIGSRHRPHRWSEIWISQWEPDVCGCVCMYWLCYATHLINEQRWCHVTKMDCVAFLSLQIQSCELQGLCLLNYIGMYWHALNLSLHPVN